MRSFFLLILFLAAPIGIAMKLPEYGPDVTASLTQPLLVVYLITTVFLIPFGRRAALFAAAGATLLAIVNWTDRTSIPSSRTDTIRTDTIALKVIHYNAGELANHQNAADWITQESPDIVFIVQGDSELLQSEALNEALPYRMGGYSHAILSRWPLSVAIDRKTAEPSTRRFLSTTLAAIIDIDGAMPLLAVSPSVPSPRSRALWQNAQERLDGAARIAVALRWNSEAAMIAAGDFNSAPTGVGYRDFQKRTGLLNADQRFFKQATWPTYVPRLFGLAIDHVLVSPHFAVQAHRVGPNLSGDHRPVIVELSIGSQSSSLGMASSKAASDL